MPAPSCARRSAFPPGATCWWCATSASAPPWRWRARMKRLNFGYRWPMASPEQSVTSLDQTFERGGLYSVRAAVAAHASSLGASPSQVGHLVLIASELVTNAVTYGGGSGRIRLWREN